MYAGGARADNGLLIQLVQRIVAFRVKRVYSSNLNAYTDNQGKLSKSEGGARAEYHDLPGFRKFSLFRLKNAKRLDL